MGWSTEVFDAHETRFTIFIDFGPRTPLAPDRLRLIRSKVLVQGWFVQVTSWPKKTPILGPALTMYIAVIKKLR